MGFVIIDTEDTLLIQLFRRPCDQLGILSYTQTFNHGTICKDIIYGNRELVYDLIFEITYNCAYNGDIYLLFTFNTFW